VQWKVLLKVSNGGKIYSRRRKLKRKKENKRAIAKAVENLTWAFFNIRKF